MKNNSTVSSLSALIQEKAQADREQVEKSTIEQLSLHRESLKQLSADALNTTRCAIEESQHQLSQALSIHQQALHSMAEQLETTTRNQTKRLIWIARLPLLIVLFLCLLICFGTLEYWKINQPTETISAKNGQQWQVMKQGAGWMLCENLTPPRPCRRLDSSTN